MKLSKVKHTPPCRKEQQELDALRKRVQQLSSECAMLRSENSTMKRQLKHIRDAAFEPQLRLQHG